MLHPDYQHSPKLVTAMASMIALGSVRRGTCFPHPWGNGLGGWHAALQICGEPRADAHAERAVGMQTVRISHRLPGLEPRGPVSAAAARLLRRFHLDNQMLTQAISFGFRVGEISCPTRYFPEASSIGFGRSVKYGLGVPKASALYRLHHWRLREAPFLTDNPALRVDGAPALSAAGRNA